MRATAMKLRFLSWLLAAAALVLGVEGNASSGTWRCEGRNCGITPWFCCCVSPAGQRDRNCRTARWPGAARTLCPAICNCNMAVRALKWRRTGVTVLSLAVDSPSTPPGVFDGFVVPAASVPLRYQAWRGPPYWSAVFRVPSLRGPPEC